MKRFSVIYTLRKQYHQMYCATLEEAKTALQQISGIKGRVPIGIYDAKTELFSWEPRQQDAYNHADIEEQGKLGSQIIGIAQALRYRDIEWQRSGAPSRLSYFA
ncbi:hypothetical protein [Spirosoma sp. KNUC1025]|uniref:hypothetical protein n=1 Tax=Spirosoma sp. KNUC1025 TaxID=2894082 RepID=UPI00386AF594|nr:hypothetical protein LN737_25715 [Spirosoma sp. KNUC1025]